MISMMLEDSTLKSLTPCVNAPWLPYLFKQWNYGTTFSSSTLMCQIINIIWRFLLGAWVFDFENFDT
jgi:hypothetical protein